MRDLATLLREEPYRFEFFQAVRVLNYMSSTRQPVGRDAPSADEVARFRVFQSLSFPPSEVMQFDEFEDPSRPPEMTVAFMGLTGSMGALPRYYTELILDRRRRKDTTLRDFLDLFNHRLISLFYRVWEKHHFCFGFELAERQARKLRSLDRRKYQAFIKRDRRNYDLFSQILLDFAGMGSPATRYHLRLDPPRSEDSPAIAQQRELSGRSVISDHTWRFYSGLLARQQSTAIGLSRMLEGYFQRRVRIREFIGQWIQLDEEYQSQLGMMNGRLGLDTVAGERVWDCQGKFRIQIGPVDFDEFQQFQPSGTSLRAMAQLTRLSVGQHLDFDVQVILRHDAVPPCQLGGPLPPRLGWNTWLHNKEFEEDVADAIFLIDDQVSTSGLQMI